MSSEVKVPTRVHSSPQNLVGRSVPRETARRLVSGRGRYLDDIHGGEVYHIAYYRSPFARAKFTLGDLTAAASSPGVYRIVTGAELAEVCSPGVTRLDMLPDHVSPPEYALAIDEVYWQGEPVVAVVAKTRAQAEDALDAIEIDWEDLEDRKSTRLNSSHVKISYAVF